jgi:hypothetical protein
MHDATRADSIVENKMENKTLATVNKTEKPSYTIANIQRGLITFASNQWQRIGRGKRAENTESFNLGIDSFNGYCGANDVQGGQCEKFALPLGDSGELVNVYRHAQGTFMVEGMLMGKSRVSTDALNWTREQADIISAALSLGRYKGDNLELPSEFCLYLTTERGTVFGDECEIRELAKSGKVARFEKTDHVTGKKTIHEGIQIGTLEGKRCALLEVQGDKLKTINIVCIHHGYVAPGEEADQCSMMGDVDKVEADQIRLDILQALDCAKGFALAENTARKGRSKGRAHAKLTAHTVSKAARKALKG